MELERAVPDVRAYLADWLNGEAARRGDTVMAGLLFSPVDVPLPDGNPRQH